MPSKGNFRRAEREAKERLAAPERNELVLPVRQRPAGPMKHATERRINRQSWKQELGRED